MAKLLRYLLPVIALVAIGACTQTVETTCTRTESGKIVCVNR